MLYWALTFFLVALVAAILGFGGVAVAAAGVAKLLFFIFLVLFIVSLVAHAARRVSHCPARPAQPLTPAAAGAPGGRPINGRPTGPCRKSLPRRWLIQFLCTLPLAETGIADGSYLLARWKRDRPESVPEPDCLPATARSLPSC